MLSTVDNMGFLFKILFRLSVQESIIDCLKLLSFGLLPREIMMKIEAQKVEAKNKER